MADFDVEPIPETLHKDITPKQMNDWLCFFIFEVRRKTDGEPYPGRTLEQMISLLNTYFRDYLDTNMRILDDNNDDFRRARLCLDSRMAQLGKEDVGLAINSSDDVSAREEQTLWETGVLCTTNAVGISNILFLYNCIAFGLRGFKEH